MTKASDNDFPSVLLTEQGSAPASPAAGKQRAYIRTSDHTLVTVNSSGTVAPVGAAAANLASGSAIRTSGDLTTTSTSFIDATGISVTITTGARRCLITCQITAAPGSGQTQVDIDIDGTRQGQDYGLAFTGVAANVNLSFSFITAALTAGSHTFKLKWRVDGGTSSKLFAQTALAPLSMQVVELYAA